MKNVKKVSFKNGTPKIRKNLKGTTFSLLTGGGKFKLLALVIRCASKILILKKANNKEISIIYFQVLKKFQNETLDLLSIPKEKDYLARILGILSQNKLCYTFHTRF